MKKSIGVMLCICLLSGPVSGCGAEENHLTEDNNTAVVEEISESEMVDAAESDNEQEPVEQTEAEAAATPVQMQEITVDKRDYLLAEVPELLDIAHYIHQKTGGQAYFQLHFNREPDDQVTYQGKVLPYYYDYCYVSVVWPDHEEEGIWFYVGKYEGQILCRENDEEEPHTLEEWRAGDGYAAGMDAVFEWQQERTKMFLASEDEGLDEPWYEAYKSIIVDWTKIKDVEDWGWGYYVYYLNDECVYHTELYFEFCSYWLCDIDRNGTPELFLWDPDEAKDYTEGVVILTYTDRPIVIFGDSIYGVNVETGEIIIYGHCTGAGGTNEYEWSGYRMQGYTIEGCFYIDSWAEYEEYTGDTPYVVDYPGRNGDKWQADGREYEEIYDNHIANCIPVEDFVMYDMMDLSGLKDIQ
ncbi:MAG: hypothetical protein J1E83_01745 [Lachnospiraceae bacterium]|nr:hypothetical protein [Lachnospiraceae bacterium]